MLTKKKTLSVTIIGILRLVWIVEVLCKLRPLPKDFTYDIRFVYSTVDTNVAIIAANGPAMYPLFRRWLPRMLGRGSCPSGSNKNVEIKSGGVRGGHTLAAAPNTYGARHVRYTSEIRGKSQSSSREDVGKYHDGIVHTREFDVYHGARNGSESGDGFI